MSPDVAMAPNVAGTVDCGEHAVATGCTGAYVLLTKLTLLLKLVHQLTVIRRLSLAWPVSLCFLNS